MVEIGGVNFSLLRKDSELESSVRISDLVQFTVFTFLYVCGPECLRLSAGIST
jgi:hypothetical protein